MCPVASFLLIASSSSLLIVGGAARRAASMKYCVLLNVVSTRIIRRSTMPSRSPVQGLVTSPIARPMRPFSVGAWPAVRTARHTQVTPVAVSHVPCAPVVVRGS